MRNNIELRIHTDTHLGSVKARGEKFSEIKVLDHTAKACARV